MQVRSCRSADGFESSIDAAGGRWARDHLGEQKSGMISDFVGQCLKLADCYRDRQSV